jgi:hypothetical protein
MHCLSSAYSVTIPLHVSVLLVAHHQEVAMYICDSWYVLYVLVDCGRRWMARRQSTDTYVTLVVLQDSCLKQFACYTTLYIDIVMVSCKYIFTVDIRQSCIITLYTSFSSDIP